MSSREPMPPAGTGTLAGNLELFIAGGLATLAQVVPAFVGLLSQPNVLTRFHAMVGGDPAFGAGEADRGGPAEAGGGAQPEAGEGEGCPRSSPAICGPSRNWAGSARQPTSAPPQADRRRDARRGAAGSDLQPRRPSRGPSPDLPARLAAAALAGLAPPAG